MGVEVEVHLSIPIINQKVREELERKFNAIHDQTFKQRVNYDASNNFKGKVVEMRHEDNEGAEWLWINPQDFFIPCHWSVPHAEQTQRDIKKVLKEWGKLKYRTRVSA